VTTRSPITTLGLQIPGFAFPGVPDAHIFSTVKNIALRAEEAGFDSIWIMDHLHQIAAVGDEEDPILEAYTTLAALAACTSSAALGALVTAGGFRNPALLAKMVTTIDVISGGRAILGIGGGWHEEEHASYGMPFPPVAERIDRLAEVVEICRAMFRDHRPQFTGKHHSIDGPLNVPMPLHPDGPPILIGGGGEKKLIPTVARLGDACNFFGAPATVRHKIDVLERACDAVGRDPGLITKTWLGTAIVARDEEELQLGRELLGRQLSLPPDAAAAFAISGLEDEVLEQVAAYRAVGVDGVLVALQDPHTEGCVERAGAVLRAAMDA
jgi:F420-dependent oxidoreductase-like protein